MTTELKNLGWANDDDEYKKIQIAERDCRGLAHVPVTKKTGAFGTVSVMSCDKCGYVYRIDSGD